MALKIPLLNQLWCDIFPILLPTPSHTALLSENFEKVQLEK